MRILIVNGYVRENKGDAALIDVLAKQLLAFFPKSDISISGMEDPQERPEFYGFKNVGSLRLYATQPNITRFKRILRKLFVAILGIVWPMLPLRSFITKFFPIILKGELLGIEEADIVVSASGGYLSAGNSFSASLHLYYTNLPIRLAERIGKMVFLAPQSFGPLGNNWQRRLIRKTLNNAKLIFVREGKSYGFLKQIGVKENLLVPTIDSGFAHTTKNIHISKSSVRDLKVGITARAWMSQPAQSNYELALASFINDIEKKYGAKVILIPQVTSSKLGDDDRIVEARIKNLAIIKGAHPKQITSEMDHYDIKDLYSTLDFTIGTRFHSVIFSLISNVPAIAIEYEYKTSGIMHDLKLDEWVIKIEDVTCQRLNDLFARLITHQDVYRKHLAAILPEYIQRADEVPFAIRQAYEQRPYDFHKKL